MGEYLNKWGQIGEFWPGKWEKMGEYLGKQEYLWEYGLMGIDGGVPGLNGNGWGSTLLNGNRWGSTLEMRINELVL